MVEISNVRAKSHSKEAAESAPKRVSIADQFRDDATRIERERDSIGRMIGVKKLSFLDINKVTALAGENANNAAYLNQCTMAASIVEIDGEPISRPTTILQLEAIMARADWPGIQAAIKAMSKYKSYDAVGEAEELKN